MSSLSIELAERIAAYCEVKGNSLTTLSRDSAVPYGSVKRIAQGETIPEFYNTLKLLMVLGPTPSACYDFIKRHYSDVGEFLTKVNFQPAAHSLSGALSDKVSFYIMHLAATRGTSRDEILIEYGRSGLATLESLLDQGTLHEINGRIRCDDFSYPDIETVLKQIRFLIEDFDASKLGNKESMVSLQVFGLNDVGVAQVYAAQKDFLERVCAVKGDPAYNGERIMFLATLFNSMGSKS